MTDMYLKMSTEGLVYHYAYLTQAMINRAVSVQRRISFPDPDIKRKPRGKLNAEGALKIYKSRLPHVELARRFNVHHTTISNIKNGVTWSNVTGHKK